MDQIIRDRLTPLLSDLIEFLHQYVMAHYHPINSVQFINHMPQIAAGIGCFALEGMNYSLPDQGFPIYFLGIFHFKNPLIILDLIFTLRGFPTKDTILGQIDKASILASSRICDHWPIVHFQILFDSSVHWVGGDSWWYDVGIGSGSPQLSKIHIIHVDPSHWNHWGRICLLWGLVHSTSWRGGAHSFTLAMCRPSTIRISHWIWLTVPIQCSLSIRASQNWHKSTSSEDSIRTSHKLIYCKWIGTCPVVCTRTTTMVFNSLWYAGNMLSLWLSSHIHTHFPGFTPLDGSSKEWRSGKAAVLVALVPITGCCGLVAPITKGFIIPPGPSLLEDTGVVTWPIKSIAMSDFKSNTWCMLLAQR